MHPVCSLLASVVLRTIQAHLLLLPRLVVFVHSHSCTNRCSCSWCSPDCNCYRCLVTSYTHRIHLRSCRIIILVECRQVNSQALHQSLLSKNQELPILELQAQRTLELELVPKQ